MNTTNKIEIFNDYSLTQFGGKRLSADEKRSSFRTLCTHSIDDETDNGNISESALSSNVNSIVLDELIKNSYTNEDEGISYEPPACHDSRQLHSFSVPLDASYAPITKSNFDAPTLYNGTATAKSIDNPRRHYSMEEMLSKRYHSDNAIQRRTSYGQDSGYGSKGSTESDITTPATPNNVECWDLNSMRERRKSSAIHDLETLAEGSEQSGSTTSSLVSSVDPELTPNEYDLPQSPSPNERKVLDSVPICNPCKPNCSVSLNNWSQRVTFQKSPSQDALNKQLKMCRHRCQEDYVREQIRRGQSPEALYLLTQRLCSIDSTMSIFLDGTGRQMSLQGPMSPIDSLALPSIDDTDNQCSTLMDSDTQEMFDSEELLDLLRAAVGCPMKCSDFHCQQGHRLLEYIKSSLEQPDGTGHKNLVLKTIAEHSQICDELKCTVPWCSFFNEHDLPFEEQLAKLYTLHFSGCVTLTSENSYINDVTELVPSCGTELKEHVDWFGSVHLGNYGNVVFSVSAEVFNPDFWVVKRESKDLLYHVEILRILRNHPRIVRHLWILEQDNYLYVAAKFEGASVADRMLRTAQGGLATSCILHYMEQLTSATNFLHRHNVAYLNWTVDNILLNADMKRVKLCNFSCAVLIKKVNTDEEKLEDLKLLLPPRIVPPEVYQGKAVEAASDVWGLGCVCYQMVTGHMLYDQYRHCNPANIREVLEESCPEPNLIAITDTSLRDILNQCLQLDPAKRMPAPELHKRLIIPPNY